MRAGVCLHSAQGTNSRGAAPRSSGCGGAGGEATAGGLSSNEGRWKGKNGENGEAEHSWDGTRSLGGCKWGHLH